MMMLITYFIHRHQYFHGVNYENYAWNVAELRYESAYNSAYNKRALIMGECDHAGFCREFKDILSLARFCPT